MFATKNRSPFITPDVEGHLYPYLHECITEQGCVVSIINGMPDHIHLLLLQNPSRSMADVIKNIKGNSSHWINQNEICPSAFSWQTGYAAFSVSDRIIGKVYQYIANQKQHHEMMTFMTEYKNIIEKHHMHSDQ